MPVRNARIPTDMYLVNVQLHWTRAGGEDVYAEPGEVRVAAEFIKDDIADAIEQGWIMPVLRDGDVFTVEVTRPGDIARGFAPMGIVAKDEDEDEGDN